MQTMIDAIMVRNAVDSGINYFTRQDVRQHLLEVALKVMRRFDGSVKPITYLWPRLNGACLDLIRNQGTYLRDQRMHMRGVKDNRGVIRATHTENLVYMGRDRNRLGKQHADSDEHIAARDPDPYDKGETDAIDQACDLSDLTLAMSRLPGRQRTILYLLYYEMQTPEEAARRLGVTADLLREIRDAALLKLRLALSVDCRSPQALRFSQVR